MRARKEGPTADFLSILDHYSISYPIARLAGELKRDYSKKGKTLSIPDTLIAATAMHNNLMLLTDNVKDFPMETLNLYPLPD